jgi:hypothetical protein
MTLGQYQRVCIIPVGPGAVGGSARVAAPEEIEVRSYFRDYAEYARYKRLHARFRRAMRGYDD